MPKALPSSSDARSRGLRRVIVETMRCGGRGHLASALSLVEILRVLYDDILRYDPANPGWPDRDRCILSKGHGCLALYAILADKGFFPKEELTRFCNQTGILGGHPERGKVPGVEASTGSLGHGPPIGVGMALAARMDGRSSRVFVIIGDGEAGEGSVWEAALCAGKHGLDNLTVLVDYNKLQSYGPVAEVAPLEPFADKWKAFGFAATEVDGHDPAALAAVLSRLPLVPGKPSAIICHTVKGKGFAEIEGNLSWHHKSKIADETVACLLEQLGDC
ncbi:MAG: transketolase [Solidesulfovibrio sp.]